jgi:hypothetical protein
MSGSDNNCADVTSDRLELLTMLERVAEELEQPGERSSICSDTYDELCSLIRRAKKLP